jgi:hypothetical protein
MGNVGTTTLSLMTSSIMTLSITTHSMNKDTCHKHKATGCYAEYRYAGCYFTGRRIFYCYALCRYAECHYVQSRGARVMRR